MSFTLSVCRSVQWDVGGAYVQNCVWTPNPFARTQTIDAAPLAGAKAVPSTGSSADETNFETS